MKPSPIDIPLLPSGKQQVFLLGWPKAGTSSLFNWLAAHPAVSGSKKKETYLFIDEDYPAYRRHKMSIQIEGYSKFIEQFDRDKAIWLEGTTHSVYQKFAARYLSANRDQSQGVLILREPAARIYSSFSATKNNFSTADHRLSWDDYVEHLLAGTVERLERYYSSATSFNSAKMQLNHSNYAEWIRKWQSVLGKHRLHVLLFDDMQNDPRSFTRSLAERLGIAPNFYEDFDFRATNETVIIRNHALHRVAKRVRKFLPSGDLRKFLKKRYLAFQNDESLREDPREGIARLRSHFGTQVDELENLTGLDLSRWRT